MAEYASTVKPRSVDEIALWLEPNDARPAFEIGQEIKRRIRDEVGEYLSSSVGIGPNWLLAKTASNFRKPDGLFEITRENTRQVLGELQLTDLCGIARRMEVRLNVAGIRTPLDLYDLPPWELKRRLGMVGYYWHLRLRGYSIDTEDWDTKTLGHSSVIPKPTKDPADLKPLLHKLTHRVARRLRKEGWRAGGLTISGSTREWGRWVHTVKLAPTDRRDALYAAAWELLSADPPAVPLRKLAVTTFDLQSQTFEQPPLFPTDPRPERALAGANQANDKWGEYTVIPAAMLDTKDLANDAIAFGQDLKLQREASPPRD
jgi:DNA polymerase-4